MIPLQMNSEIKMQFGDYVFMSNPSNIEIISNRNVSIKSIYGKKSVTQNVSGAPVIIKGSGMFFGENAQEACTYLKRLLDSGKSDILHCPGAYPIKAYFTSFSYKENANSEAMEYTFEFTEICSDASQTASYDCTSALDGENAFDIAARCGVEVDDIMRLNSFETPFEINEGERVTLR